MRTATFLSGLSGLDKRAVHDLLSRFADAIESGHSLGHLRKAFDDLPTRFWGYDAAKVGALIADVFIAIPTPLPGDDADVLSSYALHESPVLTSKGDRLFDEHGALIAVKRTDGGAAVVINNDGRAQLRIRYVRSDWVLQNGAGIEIGRIVNPSAQFKRRRRRYELRAGDETIGWCKSKTVGPPFVVYDGDGNARARAENCSRRYRQAGAKFVEHQTFVRIVGPADPSVHGLIVCVALYNSTLFPPPKRRPGGDRAAVPTPSLL